MPASPTLPLAERAQMKALLLANPNHFGNLKDSAFSPVLSIVSDTAFEQLGGVGYQSQIEVLEAVVAVKQGAGYGGSLCTPGSLEYVRFYTSSDNGATWVDQGLTSVNVHDLGGTTFPVEYAVSLQIDPAKRYCFAGANLPLVRAILSWSVAPPANQPSWTPVWGNVVNTQIQIESLKLITIGTIFEQAQLPKALAPLVAAIDPAQTVTAAPKPLSAAALETLYKGAVPPHRFALADLHKLAAMPATLASAKSAEAITGVKLAASVVAAALAPSSGDTAYEQLTAVGYNASLGRLEGVVHVKQESGYSGGICTAGSTEYVAFWADNGSGTYSVYLGTAAVGVYDIPSMPATGLDYAVFLPVDLSKYQKLCSQGAVLLPIRATLSWQVPPTPANSGYVPTWGNTVQVTIQVAPGQPVGSALQPAIFAVGDVGIENLDKPSLGLATGSTIQTGLTLQGSPFGGTITVAGEILNGTSSTRYRLMCKPHSAPDSAYTPLTDEPQGLSLEVFTPPFSVGTVVIHADASGYYTYQDATDGVLDHLLMRWYSPSTGNGTYDLRLDVAVDNNPANDIHSNVVSVVVDNTAPVVNLTVDTPVGQLCPDVTPGQHITGTFSATDAYFQSIGWSIAPSLPPTATPPGGFTLPPALTPGSPGTLTSAGYSGWKWDLATNAEPPCGYALTLTAWNWANLNSGASHNWTQTSIGFCIMPPGTILTK